MIKIEFVKDFLNHVYESVTHIEWVEEKIVNGKTVLEKIDLEKIGKVGNQDFYKKFSNYRVVDFKVGREIAVIIKRA